MATETDVTQTEAEQGAAEQGAGKDDAAQQTIPLGRFNEVVAKRRAAEAEAQKLRQQIEQLGAIDPDEYRTLKAAQEKAEQERLKKEGDFEALKNQLRETHQKAVEQKDAEIARYRTALERHLIEATAIAAIAEERGSAKLLLPHVVRRARMVEEDGEVRVEIMGANGEPMFTAEGERATIADVVREMKASDDYAGAFEASGKSGSGASGGSRAGRGGAVATLEQFDAISSAERTALYHENPDLYRTLMAQKRAAAERALLGH
jgi:hypothetical protein